MTDQHPTREDLRRYLAANLSPQEGQWIEDHLRKEGCTTCLFLARELLKEAGPDLREAARRMKVARSTIQRWRSLARKTPPRSA